MNIDLVPESNDLHSTMYLLNPLTTKMVCLAVQDLHSTMYLLNRRLTIFGGNRDTFTFHYVSIKSCPRSKGVAGSLYLHSTMYLLNLLDSPWNMALKAHLHSTMYLLNQNCKVIIGTIGANLHSTMYLLNLKHHKTSFKHILIYIPLCIY